MFRVTDSGNVTPTRVLKGPKTQIRNPTGIYVDTVNNELVVANMGNHRATVYPRAAQGDTPPIRIIRTAADGTPALQIGNPGAELSGSSADCGLRQAGEGRRRSTPADLRTGHQAQPDDA